MFQSTPSEGKATYITFGKATTVKRFNPRLPGGRRPQRPVTVIIVRGVSIHAFRGEGDPLAWIHIDQLKRGFNPRLPGGRRPAGRHNPGYGLGVSIHAFRGEGDRRSKYALPTCLSFNPRLPGGRRHSPYTDISTSERFQSTPSGGKATGVEDVGHRWSVVSIHAFRGEGDGRGGRGCGDCCGFQSTPSGGKATISRPMASLALRTFQSTPSGGKATHRRQDDTDDTQGFNPRLPGGRRRSQTM